MVTLPMLVFVYRSLIILTGVVLLGLGIWLLRKKSANLALAWDFAEFELRINFAWLPCLLGLFAIGAACWKSLPPL